MVVVIVTQSDTHLLPEQQQDTQPVMGTVTVTFTGTGDIQAVPPPPSGVVCKCDLFVFLPSSEALTHDKGIAL